MRVISLGWGVQSFAMAAMSALGELEKVDYAVHADTLFERQATYDFAAEWTSWLEDHGIKVVTVRRPDGDATDAINKWGGVFVPAFTLMNGRRGMLRRQCTGRWKIRWIRKWLQENRDDDTVEMWLGITKDEVKRAKTSDVKYIEHRWPLLEWDIGNMGMSRYDVTRWLLDHSLDVPPRSACIICPFQTDDEWQSLTNEEFERAIEIDARIRNTRPKGPIFLHSKRIPLEQAVVRQGTKT